MGVAKRPAAERESASESPTRGQRSHRPRRRPRLPGDQQCWVQWLATSSARSMNSGHRRPWTFPCSSRAADSPMTPSSRAQWPPVCSRTPRTSTSSTNTPAGIRAGGTGPDSGIGYSPASRTPYNSWGNGAAMRVSPVGFALSTLEDVPREAKRTAEVTHNHPEGIRGAQATAAAIFLGRQGETMARIRRFIQQKFHYNLTRTIAEIRPTYSFNESCQETVPEAIIAFLDSSDYEEAVRLAISLGGDADTLACIAGGIAEAFYGGVPRDIAEHAMAKLDDELRDVVVRYHGKYGSTTH